MNKNVNIFYCELGILDCIIQLNILITNTTNIAVTEAKVSIQMKRYHVLFSQMHIFSSVRL